MGAHLRFPAPRRGFTLIELLVVVAIIALLISILLPSLNTARQQAQAVACRANISQINLGLRSYMEDHNGYLPNHIWSESAWGTISTGEWFKSDLWFYTLFPDYVGDGGVYQCPGDPYKDQFDFEAREDNEPDGALHEETTVPSCGYGMNYLFREADGNWGDNDWKPYQIEGVEGPDRLENSILLAEVGPDTNMRVVPIYNYGEDGLPWRDGGRLIYDDGARGFLAEPVPTWLTMRHRGTINMLAMDGAVRVVNTEEWVTGERLILNRYRLNFRGNKTDCWGRKSDGSYICGLCQAGVTHYTFADDNLWWWYGSMASVDNN